jgi:hypothetical protein
MKSRAFPGRGTPKETNKIKIVIHFALVAMKGSTAFAYMQNLQDPLHCLLQSHLLMFSIAESARLASGEGD